jgi:hypothetical protein
VNSPTRPLQFAFEIPPAIGNRNDLHPRFQNAEDDCHPALKADGAQAGQDIITASAALGEGRQGHTGITDASDIANRYLGTGLAGDVIVKFEESFFSLAAENNLMRLAWLLSPYGHAALLAAGKPRQPAHSAAYPPSRP